MNRLKVSIFRHLSIVTISLAIQAPVHATTVYKTVDENGVVSFSDALPDAGQTVETLQVEVTEPAVNESEQERLEAIRETTDRMVADRMAREKHRAEIRQLEGNQVQEIPASQEPQYYGTSTIYRGYSETYPRYGWRHPNRPGYRPKPEHPIARPPLRPGQGQGQGQGHRRDYRSGQGYRAPLYNDYPASLVRKGYDPRVRRVIETGHYPSRR